MYQTTKGDENKKMKIIRIPMFIKPQNNKLYFLFIKKKVGLVILRFYQLLIYFFERINF